MDVIQEEFETVAEPVPEIPRETRPPETRPRDSIVERFNVDLLHALADRGVRFIYSIGNDAIYALSRNGYLSETTGASAAAVRDQGSHQIIRVRHVPTILD